MADATPLFQLARDLKNTSRYLKLRATRASQRLWLLLVSETRESFVRLNMKNSTKKIVFFLVPVAI